MKKRFAFVTLLIAMVVLTQIPVSLVRAVDTGLPPISGSDCDPTTFEYLGHTIAEGFAVSISADLPFDGPITQIKFGGAIAGLGDTWNFIGAGFYIKYTPYVKEMWVNVEGDDHYTASEIAIYDNTGTGGPSSGLFSAVLDGIGLVFSVWQIYDWLAEVYQDPPVQEWQDNGHWSKAIIRQVKETGTDPLNPLVNPNKPRLQTGSANLWGYFEEDSSDILTITAQAEIYVQAWDQLGGYVTNFYVGTYSVSFEVSVEPDTFTQTRYMQGESHRVNECPAYKLSVSQSNRYRSGFTVNPSMCMFRWGIRVWKVSNDGTKTEITNGSPVAIVYRTRIGEGFQAATWHCPEIALTSTDAILVWVWNYDYTRNKWVGVLSGAWFITEQLGGIQLNDAIWTVHYYTSACEYRFSWRGMFHWGTPTYNSRIEGFCWTGFCWT